MADRTDADEFRSFVRELGIRAFDQFASRFATGSHSDEKAPERGLVQLASCWSRMKTAEKKLFFDEMIDAAQSEAVSASAGLGASPKKAKASSPTIKRANAETQDKKGKKIPKKKAARTRDWV